MLVRLHERGEFPNIIFSDEKNCTIQQMVNKQNDRNWLKRNSIENLEIRGASRMQKSASVWAAVSANFRFSLVFHDPGVKVNATDCEYRETVLKRSVLPWTHKTFGNTSFTF